MGTLTSLQAPAFDSFVYIPRSGTAGSRGNFIFNFHTVFPGCSSLRSQQQCPRVPISPHPPQHLSALVFLKVAILARVRRSLTVVHICLSLKISDGHYLRSLPQHLCKDSLAICRPFLEKCLLRLFVHFLLGLLFSP